MVTISKKNKVIKKIKKFIIDNNLDGYIIPKNDSYFTEYSNINYLKKVTNFTGSAGFALILKKKNYLFVDGRYVLQAKRESGKKFIILEIPYKWPKNLSNIQKSKIGFNPKLFTDNTLVKYFDKKVNLIPIIYPFERIRETKLNKMYHLNKSIAGETYLKKLKKIKSFLNLKRINYLYISASENVNWLLNIRGKDLPNSPLINCKLIVPDNGKLYLFINSKKIPLNKMQYLKNIKIYNENSFFKVISNLNRRNFAIDKNTCSIFEKQIIKSKFQIVSEIDPIYNLKSIKNKIEINNTIKAHIEDGVAITKFLYWFKTKKNQMTEAKVEKKLEILRKKSKNYLYPSFDTIAGSGPNGSIIHYKSNKITNRKLNKKDILLIDSGGQYKWGTTDVTRTTCLGKVSNSIKNNFTRVLKGHIAVVKCNLNHNTNGYLIDRLARKYLNEVGLDYSHGTGHGVGFFLNVHEGPQAISKYNKVPITKGMVLSNEPGYYLNNNYGIRIENLIYVDEFNKNLIFKNLTLAPIDIDMINFKMLNKHERKYLFYYHLDVYAKISKYLNNEEKKWLLKLIK